MTKSPPFILLLLAILVLSPAKSTSSRTTKIILQGCHVAFSVPSRLEYIELDSSHQQRNSNCNISFKIKGRHAHDAPKGMIEGWREMVDMTLSVNSMPLKNAIKNIESLSLPSSQSKIFQLISKNEIDLKNGKLYKYTYSTVHPTSAMLRLRQTGKVIFVLGDNTHSISYTYYMTNPPDKEKTSLKTINMLFHSFEFK